LRVVVIGGGLGGLSVGALLHRRVFEVILFEKEGNLGGRAAVSEIQGFRVDHGIHASLFAEKRGRTDSEGDRSEIADEILWYAILRGREV
jgi:phytoene dehydrogenase-like protein